MARRSPRKKTLSPETVPETVSDDDNFVAVASDDPYVFFILFLEGFVAFLNLIIYRLEEEDEEEVSVHNEKDNKTLAKKKTNNSRGKYGPFVPFVRKDTATAGKSSAAAQRTSAQGESEDKEER